MDKIKTTDVYVPVGADNPNIAGDFISNDGQSLCRLERKEGLIVLTVGEFEQKVREFEWAAWKAAANAYRMYPDQKHTFADYIRPEYIKSLLP